MANINYPLMDYVSTFSTILNDSGLFQDNWIEAQLSHIDKNRTRASYNHADSLSSTD